jgi:hypothetical protein
MLKPENEVDKKRFEKIKDAEEDCGCDEDTAIEHAAHEVKGLREREGRSKKDKTDYTL